MTPKPPLERDIQAAIIKYLARRVPKAIVWRQFAGGKGIRLAASKRGMPDVFMLHRGTLYGLECKRPGHGQQEDQRVWQASFEKSGGLYAVVTSVDEVEKTLKGWGI